MNTTYRGVLTLLKSAVAAQALTLPEGFALEEAMPLIQAHQITPMAYEGALYCGFSMAEPVMLTMLQRYGRLMTAASRQQEAIERVCGAFEEHGIEYMPLKGCLMKRRYPKPELRPMCDADILIRMGQYDRIRSILTELGMQEIQESDHELIWKSPELLLELHKRLIPSYNKDYYAYFGDGWRLAETREGCRYAMRPEDEYIYLFTHFAKHYRDGGIGCRHVVDLWVFRRSHPDMDEHYVDRELKALKLDRFHRNMVRVLEYWFADAGADEIVERISDFIMNSGSWGNQTSHLLAAEARNQKGPGSGVKEKALLRAIFPPAAELEYRYPILQKAPWLLPVVWVWRWVTAILFRRDNIRRRGENLELVTDASVSEYQQQLNAVGLEFRFDGP